MKAILPNKQQTHPVLFLAQWEMNTHIKTILHTHTFPGKPLDKNFGTTSNGDTLVLGFREVSHSFIQCS